MEKVPMKSTLKLRINGISLNNSSICPKTKADPRFIIKQYIYIYI